MIRSVFCYTYKSNQVSKLLCKVKPDISSLVFILCFVCNLHPGYFFYFSFFFYLPYFYFYLFNFSLRQLWRTMYNLCFVSYDFVVKLKEDFKMKALYCLILTCLAITQLKFMLIYFAINQRHQQI